MRQPDIPARLPKRPSMIDPSLPHKIIVVDDNHVYWRVVSVTRRPLIGETEVRLIELVSPMPRYDQPWLGPREAIVDEEHLHPIGSYDGAELFAYEPPRRQRDIKSDAYIEGVVQRARARKAEREQTDDERAVTQARAARQQARERPQGARPMSVHPQRALKTGESE